MDPKAPTSKPRTPSLGHAVRQANSWREAYNPLRGLTIATAISHLEAGQRGEMADLQWLYRFIERRNSTCRALIIRRRSAIQKLDWSIKLRDDLPPGIKPAVGIAQKELLRAAYERVDNLTDTIRWLTLAEFRGYAHLQIHRDSLGRATHFEPLDQWNWVRDGLFGDWLFNPEARSTGAEGLRTDPLADIFQQSRSDFIYRECDMPIDEIALICYLRKTLSQKDWDAFVEIYGIPSGVVTMPPNIPAGQTAEYEAAAAAVAGGGSGALPNGSAYTPNDQPRGINPFRDHIRYQDEELVLAGTAGKLTMLTESGSGTLAGNAQADTFDEIAEAEAAEISECLQRNFDNHILDRAFPGIPHLAYFELAANRETDPKDILDMAWKAKLGGLRLDPDEVAEAIGFKVSLIPEMLMPSGQPHSLPPGGGLYNRTPDPAPAAATADHLGVPTTWLEPVADLIADLQKKAADSSVTDADLATFLQQATERLPELFADMDIDGLANIFEASLGDATLDAIRAKLR